MRVKAPTRLVLELTLCRRNGNYERRKAEKNPDTRAVPLVDILRGRSPEDVPEGAALALNSAVIRVHGRPQPC
jgi:hypothetical protein